MTNVPEESTPLDVAAAEVVTNNIEALKKEDTLRFGPNVKTRSVQSYPIDKIIAPDGFNIRTAKGQVIAGIRVVKDTRNIPGMADSIRQLDGITDPLTLSEQEDGTTILLQGYRRFNGAKLVISESPGTPLAEKLQGLPVTIYSGLTQAQERQLVNDQRSKSFSALEVYRWYCEQLDGGFDWMNVLRRCYHEIGNVTGSADIVRKIDGIEDSKERDKELRKWATSYVFQWWVNSWKARPLLRTMTEHTYLWKEKLTPVRPRVVLTSMRMRELWKAADADMKAQNFNRLTGEGPLLMDKIAFFEKEDAGQYINPAENDETGERKNKKDESGLPTFRPMKEVVAFLNAASPVPESPTLVGEIIGITFKDGGAPSAVQEITNYERCKDVFTKHQANVEPKLRAGLNLLFIGGEGSAEQFEAFLKDATTPKATEVVHAEAPKTEAQKKKK